MRVLGVDPGYAACGVAVIESCVPQRWRAVELATIRTAPEQALGARLDAVWEGLRERFYQPLDLVSLEAQEGAQHGHQERGTTSAEARHTLVVCGLVRALALQHGVRLVEVAPSTWRRTLALRRTASKAQARMVVRALLLGCPAKLSLHASDAAAIALCGARLVRHAVTV